MGRGRAPAVRGGRGSALSPSISCEICDERVDPWSDLRYSRLGGAAQAVVAKGSQRCSSCKRHGCPRCMQVVEERVDDFFLDIFLCRGCVKRQPREEPGPV